MKRNPRHAYTIIEVLGILSVAAVWVAIWFPVSLPSRGMPHGEGRNANCQSNLKQIYLAMMQYAQDNDERLPPIALNATALETQFYGWADAIQPYAKSLQIFQCPSEQSANSENAMQRGFVDYWFNAHLNARKVTEISWPAHTFLSGEGNALGEMTDARYARRALPRAWLDNPNSPAQRHDGTGNYLFSDGHVKTYAPQLIPQVLAGAETS